jgi:Kelch motif
MTKKAVKRILRLMPISVGRIREQMEFNRLRRKPPELMWKACVSCPERRTEAHGAKIGRQFFVIGGYQTIDRVLSVIDVLDLKKTKWTDRITMPPNIPQTHCGIACGEKRFIYLVGGQIGPQCHPAVADCFVLDVQTKSWGRLPSLPEPRYSPTVKLWRGRLHVISGAKPDRWTPASDHWSIAVAGGKALEGRWRAEVPIPRGGPHRTSAVLNDRLYVFGGQEGDIRPVAADPKYRCDYDTPLEILYADSFVREFGTEPWRAVSPMPAARTHTESEVTIDHYAVIVGGNEGRLRLSDLVQVYDSRANRWRIAGRLPYCMKTTAVYYEGWLYLVTGQRSKSRNDLRPGQVLNSVWRAKFDPALSER